jgi:hypothetical protein
VRIGISAIYFNAVLAATIAGFFTAIIVAVIFSLYGFGSPPWSGSIFTRVLALPIMIFFSASVGTSFGLAIGAAVGATVSAAWAIIQRYFRLGFASDLLFVSCALSMYALRMNQLDRLPHSQLGVVIGILVLGSVIAAVTFRRLLGLPLALDFREPATV